MTAHSPKADQRWPGWGDVDRIDGPRRPKPMGLWWPRTTQYWHLHFIAPGGGAWRPRGCGAPLNDMSRTGLIIDEDEA